MKMIKIAMVAIFCSLGALFAQGTGLTPETPEARATIEKMLAELESLKDKPYDLSNRLWTFESRVLSYWNNGMRYTSQTTRNIAIRLIRLFDQLDDSGINQANKTRIIEIIGVTDNSQEARDFFKDIIENGTDKNQRMALLRITPTGVSGDDIYNKVNDLVRQGRLKRGDALGPLKRASPDRAIREISDFVKTASDLDEFIGAGRLLSSYNRAELMEPVVVRYEEMRKKWKGDYRNNPAYAVKTKLLVELAGLKEGAQLKTVLEMLNQDGTSGEDALPIMAKKIKSKDKITREAVIDFLSNQIKQGNMKVDRVRPLLESAAQNETEKALKEKTARMLKAIE